MVNLWWIYGESMVNLCEFPGNIWKYMEILIFDSFRKGIKYHFPVIFWNSPSFSELSEPPMGDYPASPGLRHRRGHHRLSLWQASVGPKAHRSASEEIVKASIRQGISLLQGGMCSKIYTYILDIYIYMYVFLKNRSTYLFIWYFILTYLLIFLFTVSMYFVYTNDKFIYNHVPTSLHPQDPIRTNSTPP